MLKGFLVFLPLISTVVMPQIQQPAQAAEAFCVVSDSDEVLYHDNCNFEQFGGNGSFYINSPTGLIAGRSVISVSIIEPGVAEVRGLVSYGINSRWGEARRSSSDTACWVGSDFTICVY